MPSTVEQVKSTLLKHDGSASRQQLARELKMGLDYIDLICRDLERRGEITFSGGFYSLPRARRRASPKSKRDIGKARFSLSSIPGMAVDLLDTLKSRMRNN